MEGLGASAHAEPARARSALGSINRQLQEATK